MIKNVLLIDDDTIYSFIFPELIRDSGLVENFHIENDGLNGLNYLETCTHNFPDLILVDLKMPVMDGFGFLAEYGPRFSEIHPKTVVMVMTSSVRQRDREQVLQYPFVSNIFSKPITESLLGQITDQYFVAS